MTRVIRSLPAQELDLVRDLRRALHEHHDTLPNPPGFRRRAFEDSWQVWRAAVAAVLAAGHGTVLIHTPNGSPLPDGMAYLRLLDPTTVMRAFLEPTGPHAELCTLVVAEAARGGGVGSALADAGADWAREHGAVALHIGVRATNLEARELYVRRGAQPTFEVLVQPL